jgi:endo-1,4-beta-D-glucanase Y
MSTSRIASFVAALALVGCADAPTHGEIFSVAGQSSVGGSTSTGATGGASTDAVGGATTGGASNGGNVTGGTSGGGTASGGTGTGGTTAGGTSAGGTLGAGGTAAGGSSLGGAPAAGGAATGGAGIGGGGLGGTGVGGTGVGGTGVGGTGMGGTGVGGSGVGGAGVGGTPIEIPFGYAPITVTWDDAVQAYEEWKSVHLENCGGGVYRVRWENARLDATVSEGIGYGMLLAVAHDEREVVDGLYQYYQMAIDEYGLMHWLRYGCDAHREQTYNEYPDNAAADADLDVAMALLQADCKWGGNYGSEATGVINAIRGSMIGDDNGVLVLQPGDSEFFDNNGCINYSYFAPAYYRAFAQHVPGDASFWNQLASDSYVLLGRASDGSTGLVRNWGSTGGGSVSGCEFAYSDDYGDDAARTPWRIGTDYLWWGTPEAKSWADRVTSWVLTQDVASLGQWYHLDGSFDTSHEGYDDHTAITLGPWAVGAMAHSQSAVDTLAGELLNIPTSSGSHDAEYFPRFLRALSLLALTGNFTPCGGD